MGITDEKLKDKRFRNNEKAIIEAFFSSKKILSVRVIVKRAKISRSTLYRHHKTIYEIVPDYEKYILKKHDKLIKGLIKRENITTKIVYSQMLIFILKNEIIFKMIVDRGDIRTIEKMIKKIEPKIVVDYKLPKNCEKILNIHRKEISGIIEKWIKEGFSSNENEVLSDILYLTGTLRNRLIPIMR